MAALKEYITNVLRKNTVAADDSFYQPHENFSVISKEYHSIILEVYQDLGGLNKEFPYVISAYDIRLENAFIIIDDETVYNRYRAVTLRSGLYEKIKGINTENHKRYCRQFESECLKTAGSIHRWKSPESEKYFGPSQETGDLSTPGSSLWKLHAFKNFLTDVAALSMRKQIFRISPYDNMLINGKMIKVKELLLKRNEVNEGYLMKYIQRGLNS
ncbi:MAG: hypothetical protein ACK40G_14395 [Cytophagaceae bacterium]